MTAISQLLAFDSSSIEAPKLFPAGEFKCKIVEADIMKGYWGKSNTFFLAYVPKIQVVEYVPVDADKPTDLDKATMDQLEKFGDWQSFAKKFTINSKNVPGFDQLQVAGIANNLNYPLVKTDETFENIVEQMPQLARFYLSADKSPNGRPRGFVTDVLKMSPPNGAPLETIINDTIGKFLLVTFGHRQEGDYDPQLEVVDTAAA